MKDSTKLKWKMIRQILKSDGCILISTTKYRMDYNFAGNDFMLAALFKRLKTFVPNWYAQVHKKYEAD